MFILILAILISIAIHLRHTRQIKTLWQGITMLAVGFWISVLWMHDAIGKCVRIALLWSRKLRRQRKLSHLA